MSSHLHCSGSSWCGSIESHVRLDEASLCQCRHEREFACHDCSADDARKASSVLARVSWMRSVYPEHGKHGKLRWQDYRPDLALSLSRRAWNLTGAAADGSDLDTWHCASDEQILTIIDGFHQRHAVGRLDVLSWILTGGKVDGLQEGLSG